MIHFLFYIYVEKCNLHLFIGEVSDYFENLNYHKIFVRLHDVIIFLRESFTDICSALYTFSF